MTCPKCGGHVRSEPARLVCANCGDQCPRRRVRPSAAHLQLLMDFALRPRSLGSTDAHTPGEYAALIGAEEACA